MGEVDHQHNFPKSGLNPSVEIANLKLHSSIAKSRHGESMCALALLSATWRTNPYVFLFSTCHYNSYDMVGDWNIHFSLGIKGKWHKAFTSTIVCPTYLYIFAPHFGQWVQFSYCPLYNMHLKMHAWIYLYFKPICCVNVLAPYMFLDRQHHVQQKFVQYGKKFIHKFIKTTMYGARIH
jgi:hypothetical protein